MTALEVIDSRHRTTLRWNDTTSSACFNRGRIKPLGHNPAAHVIPALASGQEGIYGQRDVGKNLWEAEQ